MNIPTDIIAFNASKITLEAKSLAYCMRAFMTIIMPIILSCSNCMLKIFMTDGVLYYSFASDSETQTIGEGFYGLFNNKPMNELSRSISGLDVGGGGGSGGASSAIAPEPRSFVFGSFCDAGLSSLTVSKATSIFMDHCAIFFAMVCPTTTVNVCVDLQHKNNSFSIGPWSGQRRFKSVHGEERYGSTGTFTELLSIKELKFTPGFSILDSGKPGPTEVYEISLVSRASSPLFMPHYVLDKGIYVRSNSPGPVVKFDDTIFVRALALVSAICQNNFGISILPGFFYSRSSELFEFGLCEGKQVLGLNTFNKDLKEAPDAELFLVTMCADFLDRALNLSSALVRLVCLRQPPNMDMCVECMGRGTLLCCDKCPRSYCLGCLGLLDMPSEQTWECPKHKPLAASASDSASASAAQAPHAFAPQAFAQEPPKGLKRPRAKQPEVSDPTSWTFETSGNEEYLRSMMLHAYEGVGASDYGGAAYGVEDFGGASYSGPHSTSAYASASYGPAAASSAFSGHGGPYGFGVPGGYDSSGGYGSLEHKHKKPRPKPPKKECKYQDNLLKQAFDTVLQTSLEVEIPLVYPALPVPFFGMNADDTYKHFPTGMPYVRETVKQAILNKKFKIAKPGGGATAGGSVREIGPKISWLQRDLEVCALLGFCAHDVYELYLQYDQQAEERKGTSTRGVCYVFKK